MAILQSIAFCCALTLLTMCVHGDYYSSMQRMVNFVQRKGDYLDNLENLVREEMKRLDKLQRLIGRLRQDEEPEAAHPTGVYRFLYIWYQLTELANSNGPFQELGKTLNKQNLGLITDADRTGAATAILRLQEVYSISSEAMATGRIAGSHASHMDTEEIEYMGRLAVNLNQTDLAIEWSQLAMQQPSDQPDIARRRNLVHMGVAYFKVGQYRKVINALKEAHLLDPGNETVSLFLEHCNRTMHDPERHSRVNNSVQVPPWTNPSEWMKYESLCRRDNPRDVKRESKLHCRYRPTRVPYAPVQEEVRSLDPRIVLLYGIISERDRSMFISMATSKLTRALVLSPDGAQTTERRVGEIAWLDDVDHEALRRANINAEIFTGLATHSHEDYQIAETFQVSNYGLGGQNEPHLDFFFKDGHGEGANERIATYLLYLTDVPAGGATVFPRINTRVVPVKGAAAFWYNTKLSGEADFRTLHAGCPVLLGNKWVANKWIHGFGQEFRRRCGLSIGDLDI